MVLVELTEGLSTVSSRHDFLKDSILFNILHFVLASPDALHLRTDELLDRKTRVHELLLEEETLHHVRELSMAEELSVCSLYLV